MHLGSWFFDFSYSNAEFEKCFSAVCNVKLNKVKAYSIDEFMNHSNLVSYYVRQSDINIVIRKNLGTFHTQIDPNFKDSIQLPFNEYILLGKICDCLSCTALISNQTQSLSEMYLILNSKYAKQILLDEDKLENEERVEIAYCNPEVILIANLKE